ncbi:MAG: dTDP-4-dehydrorhamnose reductase [Cyclobacteriaceae bacterium]|nr:dTDP-4-dehydrorhamnose reductase [Cyclobacteriaceae bacterium]MCK5701728.1 dTDP-4-dehydrorhamnose reductase [Cyclobacteriaceae bacterium]
MSNQLEKTTILVTGANGQLGSELNIISAYEPYHFIFTDIKELNLTDGAEVNSFFNTHKIDFCINCAAYTAVDNAEKNIEAARAVNVDAVQNIAEACTINNTYLIHISTDFVFRGNTFLPLTEEAKPDPVSVYGFTKLEGESVALKTNRKTLIIRTSWLYSSFGNNFMKTMIRFGKEREELGVVVDQIGTPTYAGDLAKAIIEIIKKSDQYDLEQNCGLYHYSNEGVASWYDFAKAILDLKSINVNLKPLKTTEYHTPAKRPQYCLMDKSKIKKTFNLKIPYWRDSLKLCLELIDD